MGLCISACRLRKVQIRIAVVGLDNAGKSTVINQIMGDYQGMVTPTLGFSSFTKTLGRAKITIYDLGGSSFIRKYWSNYYHELHGIIFVIDSSDLARLEESRSILHEAAKNAKIAGKPILIFANKQDLPNHLTADEISKGLDMGALLQTPYHVRGSIAYTENRKIADAGIAEGIDWLQTFILDHHDELQNRAQIEIAEWTKQEAEKKNQQIARVAAVKAEREKMQMAAAEQQTSNLTVNDLLLPGQLPTDSPK